MKNLTQKKLLACILFFAFAAIGHAQFAQRSSLGVSGSSNEVTVNDKTYVISASIGQRSVIGTIGSEEVTLRQGFQQPPIRVASLQGTTPSLSAFIFPNPVKSFVTVSFQTSIKDDIQAVLYDIQGREILKMHSQPVQSFEFDMSSLSAGTYLLTIQVAADSFSTRLIKN